jgi:hypothetical protein
MTANETLSFSCPACATRLTVPAALAGVVGPCPTCGSTIQAPMPAPSPGIAPIVTPKAEESAPAAARPQSPKPEPRASLRPEPRQLPQRPAQEVCAKPMPEPEHVSPAYGHKALPLPRHPSKSSALSRCILLLLLLIFSAALVYGILAVLKFPIVTKPAPDLPVASPTEQIKHLPTTIPEDIPPPPAVVPTPPPAVVPTPPSAVVPTPPSAVVPTPPSAPTGSTTPALPTPKTARPDVSSPPPGHPAGIEPVSQGNEATDVLEKFLSAKTLDARKDLMEILKPGLDLGTTCLADSLPAVRSMTPEFRVANAAEQLTDFYHRVDFITEGTQSDPHFVLVRARGKAAPKVVIDPFLDLFGGRLAAYVASPSDKAAYFQVVVCALSTCTDTTIPDYEKKMTLKLMASDNGKEIARAYFGRQSKIASMLQDGTHDLSYGNPKPCTVMLSWNTQDKPDRPYLVANAITSLDWNP